MFRRHTKQLAQERLQIIGNKHKHGWQPIAIAVAALIVVVFYIFFFVPYEARQRNFEQQQTENRQLREQLERARLDVQHAAATNRALADQITDLSSQLATLKSELAFARSRR